MMTFIANGVMWNGMLAGHKTKQSGNEVWIKKWGSGDGGANRKWSRMSRGRMRTCATVARCLYAERKARGNKLEEKV